MLMGSIPSLTPQIEGLPSSLSGLVTLAYNLRWTWDAKTQWLLSQIDPHAWSRNISPVKSLRLRKNWEDLAENTDFVAQLKAAEADLETYLNDLSSIGFPGFTSQHSDNPVAYFCAEYALHTGMNQYAGGLGILAGDHCKEASDLGLPFVAVGLFYRRGFFHQSVDWSGRQEAIYPEYAARDLPLIPVMDPHGSEPLEIEIPLPGRVLNLRAWLVQVGRTPLLLLDSNLAKNRQEDREITSQLYTNTREMRLFQEFVLGVGGVALLRRLNIEPSCYHLNEGHSALLLLERLRHLLTEGLGRNEAVDRVKSNSILTIHTPVPEGNERFTVDLVSSLLGNYLDDSGVVLKQILGEGVGKDGHDKVFDMTAFALRHSAAANGVSLLHGHTADETWREIFGKPVQGVTNGIHMPTWLGPEMRALFHEAGAFAEPVPLSGSGEVDRPTWQAAGALDSRKLWEAHMAQKRRLVGWAQERLFTQHARHGEGPAQLARFEDALNADTLLIGFARRFATYKRAALLFSDLRRVLKIFEKKGMQVQILFAGKSHPSDRGGQLLIEEIFNLSQTEKLLGKVFLLEDYDMQTGAMLVQGVDLWLNNPRRPLEASGTSGMKAAANGVPNLSILDGWWDEGYCASPQNGWAIGKAKTISNSAEQDRSDAKALYRLLEEQVVPLFYRRGSDGIPHGWTEIMKNSIGSTLFSFSTRRMLRDYVQKMYGPNSSLMS